MGSNQKEGAIKEVIIVVRSLINSLKPPVSLQQIERDYMQVEAQPIPFRSLGYRSSLEFLQDTDAFNFQKYGNDIIISVRSNSKSGHIATLVRCQKSTGKSNKTLFIRPQAPAVRQNVRPIVNQYNNNNNWRTRTFNNSSNNYNHNNNNIPQQGQAELERLRSEIREQLSQLRKQQHECQQQELELQRYHLELRDQLKQQQKKTDTQINQLRQQHAVGLEVQADVIKKLEEERLKLQQQLKQQQREQLKAIKEAQELKQQQRQQREQAILKQQEHELQQRQKLKEAKFKQQEQELQQRQQREQAKFKQQEQELQQRQQQRQQREQAKAKQQEQELQQRKEREEAKSKQQEQKQKQQRQQREEPIIKKDEKVDNHYKIIASNILTPPNSPPEMNGNAAAPAAAAAAAGAATAAAPAPAPGAYIGRKLNLRPILGNSASQQQQQQQRPPTQEQTTDDKAAMKRPQHPRIQYSTPSRGGGTGGSSVNYRLKQQQLLKAAMSEDTTAAVPSSKPVEPKTPEKVVSIKSSIAPNTPSPMMQNKPSERTVQFRTENDEFIDGLYNALIKHNGIVINKLQQWYEDTLKRQLPSNWMDIISSSPQIRIENGVINDIVFANTPKTTTVSATEKKLANLTLNSKACTEMPELQLPWVDGQQDWSMYITHCDNTTHVWARLIEQSAHFENLTEQLNMHMSEASKRQPLQEKNEQPVEQKIYLVEVSENWNRVRVMSLDAEKRQCSCHFVDFGDEVTFSYDLLHLCPSQFLALPAQAVCLSMYALDKFEEHPHALAVLNKELSGHSVVTRIITSEKQFHAAGGLAQGVMLPVDEENMCHRRACIVGTFYDTSTAEDIHLNDMVADKIIRNTPAPQLKLEQKPNNVLVSHVNDVGDLMVQLPNEDLDFVQRCMAKMMKEDSKQQRVCYSDLLHDRLICVCDEAADGGVKQYYRGMLVTKPKTAEEEVFDVYYVDDGRLRKTHISNIYRLEANNLALASYPAQALRVRLHDVPSINGKMLDLLRRLLSPQSSVLVKVIEGVTDKLPMVNLLARGTDGLYVCINIAIRTEYEMHGSSRLEPFDDGGLHFSASGHLIRRSSFSSTVSSQSTNSSDPSTTPSSTPVRVRLLPMLKEYEAIPAVGAYFEVRVALSVNPSHFAVQPYKCYNQLQHLMKELQAHCKDPQAAQRVESNQLSIGQSYAAADSDGIYHRVTIRKIYDEMIHVRYVDVGDDAVVRCNELLQLKAQFRELPMMALPAQLHGIVLNNIVWTQENCVRFRQLTLGQKFIGLVQRVDKLQDGRRALSLELIDTSTPQDIKVHETLITEKHAKPAP